MSDLFRVSVREENAVAAHRSQIYSKLANAFRYPSDERSIEHIASGTSEREIVALLEQLDWSFPSSVTDHSEPTERVDVLYCSLFETALGRSAISLHERDHVQSGREALWEDLFRCFTHFGLELGDGGLRAPPDLLTIQLEFMHYLAFVEASNTPGSRGVILGEADFVERHLAAWVPNVCDALQRRAPSSIYARLAILLRDFIAEDFRYLESKAKQLRKQ